MCIVFLSSIEYFLPQALVRDSSIAYGISGRQCLPFIPVLQGTRILLNLFSTAITENLEINLLSMEDLRHGIATEINL
jgi:hypothetical protein